MNKHGYNMFLSMEVPFIGVIESILRFQLTTLCHLHNAECQLTLTKQQSEISRIRLDEYWIRR